MIDKHYRSVLDAMLYLWTQTRLDIATAVFLLGKLQEKPKPVYWKTLQYVLRCIAGTTNYGLLFPTRSGDALLEASRPTPTGYVKRPQEGFEVVPYCLKMEAEVYGRLR